MEESFNQQSDASPESSQETISRLLKENAELKEKLEITDEAHKEILKQLVEKEHDAYFDSLTGLRRRELFTQEMTDCLRFIAESPNLEDEKRKNRTEVPVVSLVMFDIDKFKMVNDTLGHNAGDAVLKAVAETIQRYTRKLDISARWGGEEIVLGMIGADEKTAADKANFIREKISQIEFPDYPDLKITVSAGVSSSADLGEFNDLLEAADNAMYKSKQNGRNQVTAHSGIS